MEVLKSSSYKPARKSEEKWKIDAKNSKYFRPLEKFNKSKDELCWNRE